MLYFSQEYKNCPEYNLTSHLEKKLRKKKKHPKRNKQTNSSEIILKVQSSSRRLELRNKLKEKIAH